MAITGTQFWDEFLNLLGDADSVREYYLPQSGIGIDGAFAQEGEYANVIEKLFERTEAGSPERGQAVDLLNEAGFWASTDDLNFWKNQDVNSIDINDLANAAESRLPGLFGANDEPVGQERLAEGGALSQAGILSGGVLTRIDRGTDAPLWAMTYTVGQSRHVFTFDSQDAMQEQLGVDAVTSGKYGFMTLGIDEVDDPDGNTWLMGDAAAFSGQQGSYGLWYDATMKEAALEAGVRNPGAIGDFLRDPEVQRIMAQASIGDWSDEREQAELRTTNYFQNILYPGITNFMDQGMKNPEVAYWNYMNNVTTSLDMLGYARADDGTYKNQMAEMLDGGITVDEFNTFAPTFVRAEQSQEFAGALNKWTQQDLGMDVSFEDWFDVLAGTASAELDQVVEKAQLQFVADSTSTMLSDAQITRLAELTDVSEAQMRTSFNSAEEALLAVGDRDLARYGLSSEALISAAFGVDSAGGDPLSSGGGNFSAAEIRKRAKRAATELGIQDDRKAQFFVGFDSFGSPRRQGLTASAPEAG